MGADAIAKWGTEDQVLIAIKNGDRDAVEWLFDGYGKRMHEVLMSEWGDREAVLDAIQEAFLKLYKGRARLQASSMAQIRVWLLTVANNYLRDQAKKAERKRAIPVSQMTRPDEDTDDVLDAAQDEGPSVQTMIEQIELSENVRSLLAKAGSQCAEILTLFYSRHMEIPEIAARLSMTVDQVKKRKPKCIRLIAQMARDRGMYP